MPTDNVIRALQHIALTIEQATGLEPSNIPGFAEIWGRVRENPDALESAVVRDEFIAAVNQVVPELRLNTQLQWQLLWRGATQQTQMIARRFAGVDNQALIPLRDWLFDRFGADHALFTSQEWQNVVQSGSKPQALLELRHELLLVANVDLLECPDLPDPWRLFLQKSVKVEFERDLRMQQRAGELRTQSRGELADYGKALLEAPQQPAQNAFFARRFNAAQARASAYMNRAFGPVPLEFLDVLAKTSWYLDQLSRGNYAEAAQALKLMGAEQLRFGTLMILQQDLAAQDLGEFELLVPFEFDFVGLADRALRQTRMSREELEANYEGLREKGITEFEILSWESLTELRDVRARLQAFAWAMEHFHEDASSELISDIVRAHKLGLSFSEREADLQAAAQEKWQAMVGMATPEVDWITVLFYVHYQHMLSVGMEKVDNFQHEAESIYPDRGLARYTSMNQATQDFLDEKLGNGWRGWLPVTTIENAKPFALGKNSALARFGDALVNAEASQQTMSRVFAQRFRTQISQDPQFTTLKDLPDSILGIVAQGEYYFYLIANHRVDDALSVHEQIGDAVIYFASSIRFQTFPLEVTLGADVRMLLPQTTSGELLIELEADALAGESLSAMPARVAQADPVIQIGDFFYHGLRRTAVFGAMVGELLQSPQLDEAGKAYIREYERGQIENFLHNAHEVGQALQLQGQNLSNAVEAYLATKPAGQRTSWAHVLSSMPPKVRDLFQGEEADGAEGEVEVSASSSASGGETFAPQVDPRMQALIAKLGRGTASVLPDTEVFPAHSTTTEPLEDPQILEFPEFPLDRAFDVLPASEAINPEDLPALTFERGSIVSLKVPKMLPEVDGYTFANYPAQPFTAAQLAEALRRKGISDQTFVAVRLEGQTAQVWSMIQLQEFLTDYEKNQAMSERGFAEATLPLPPILFPIGAPAALSGLFVDLEFAESFGALPALAH